MLLRGRRLKLNVGPRVECRRTAELGPERKKLGLDGERRK
jgi:hypothetical protein